MQRLSFRRAALLLACLAGTLPGCSRSLPPGVAPNLKRASEIREDLLAASSGGGAAETTVKRQDPTGWATLRGSFKVQQSDIGGLSKNPLLTIPGQDAAICAPGGKQVFAEELLVDKSTGGIANVVIYLTNKLPDDEKSIHPDAKPGKTDPVVFDQKQCIFLTHVLVMQVSQKLEIRNSDPTGHNTNLSPRASAPFNQSIPTRGSATYQHQKEEKQPYLVKCNIHPWMSAWLLPRKNSYFAVTKADGSFEIPNLPAGIDLQLRVWQEKSGFVRSATVAVNGGDPQQQKWSKGRFTLRLEPDQETQLDAQIPASAFK